MVFVIYLFLSLCVCCFVFFCFIVAVLVVCLFCLFVVRLFVAFFSFYVGIVVVVFFVSFVWVFLVSLFLTSGFLRMLSMYLIISFLPLCQVFYYFPAEWYILRYTRTDLQVNFEVLAACLQWSSARHRFSRQFYNRGLLSESRTCFQATHLAGIECYIHSGPCVVLSDFGVDFLNPPVTTSLTKLAQIHVFCYYRVHTTTDVARPSGAHG